MGGHRWVEGTEEVVYRGRRYRRHPDHESWPRRSYFMATTKPRNYLHRDVYVDHHGTIPDGWHVHHVDHDVDNNDPGNLAAIDPIEHARHHASDHPELVRVCPQCGEEFTAFREWARWCSPRCKMSYRRAEGLVRPAPRKGAWSQIRICECCGAPYGAKRPWSRFCALSCKNRAAREAARASGAAA